MMTKIICMLVELEIRYKNATYQITEEEYAKKMERIQKIRNGEIEI